MCRTLAHHLLSGVVLLSAVLTSTSPAAPQTTQPAALAQRVEGLLVRLDSERLADRQDAAGELDLLPVDALPLLEAALRAGVSPELRTALTRPVARLRQTAGKQQRYRGHLEFFRRQYAGEYQRVGQKNPAWDDAAARLLEEAARFNAGLLVHRHTGRGVHDAADAVRKLEPTDPLLRQLAIHFDEPWSLKRIVDVWPSMEASQYSAFRKAELASFIVTVAGENPSPASKDRHGVKKYITHAADYLAECLRDERFPAAVAIPHLQSLLHRGHGAGVDRKEIFELIDRRLAEVLGEEHLVRLNLRGAFLFGLAADQRNGQADETSFERSAKSLEQAETVLQRAYELYPDDRHAPTLMLDVVTTQGRGLPALDVWFQRATKADPENQPAYEKKLAALDPEHFGGDAESLAFARECLASGHFETRIPLMVVQAHRKSEQPAPWASLVPRPYYGQDDVFADIAAAYEGFLRQHPDADDDRAAYAELAWQAGRWSVAAAQYRALAARPGWDQRNVGLVRLIQRELPLRLSEPHPRPDRAALAEQRDRDDADQFRRLMVDQYEAFGRKSPRWDEPARRALAAFASDWTTDPARTGGERDAILTFGRSALDAGCDDPLVRFVHRATVDTFVTPRKPQAKFPCFADAVTLQGSDYPEAIKAMALQLSIHLLLTDGQPTDAERADCLKQLEAIIPLLEAAARQKQARHESIAVDALYLFNSVQLAGGELAGYYDRLRVALERARCEPQALQELHAYYLWRHAIGALPKPGGESQPTDEQRKSFAERTAAAEAACERLWQERPDRPGPIWLLVQIAGTAPPDAAKMAFWVRQAALADPMNPTVAQVALGAHLREGDLAPLARAAGESGAWRTQLPFMLADFHVKYASITEPGDKPADLPDVHKIAEEDVWQAIATVYEGYLARYPDDSDRRSEYASLACRAGRWLIAMDQMKILGDRVRPKAFVTAERLEACKKKAASMEAFATPPPAP